MRSVKRERIFAHVSQTTVSTGPMKMFRLGHGTMNVCQRNMARFGHVECMFDKANDIFEDFGSLVLRDGRAKSKQINLVHWNTALVVRIYVFFLIFMRMFSS